MIGNTPTGVGKTVIALMTCLPLKKHPHGRGEDSMTLSIYAIP